MLVSLFSEVYFHLKNVDFCMTISTRGNDCIFSFKQYYPTYLDQLLMNLLTIFRSFLTNLSEIQVFQHK